MRNRLFVVVGLAVLIATGSPGVVTAQDQKPAGSPQSPPERYRIGVGDVLEIRV